jgi:hypothetical protein
LLIQNLSNGSEVTRDIPAGNTSFVMTSVQKCIKYAFALIYTTNQFGNIKGADSKSIIVSDSMKIGEELEASKGYYTDRVLLSWTTSTSGII